MLIYLQMIESDADRTKFEKIYLEYRDLMFYIANQILRNTYDAEDAVHQAFVSIAENIKKISEPVGTKTKAYVVIIVEHKAIDVYREKHRGVNLPLEEEICGITLDVVPDNAVASALAKLPIKYRNYILLKYVHGYTNPEIAELYGISYEGVHSLDRRVKAKLRELLEKNGVMI